MARPESTISRGIMICTFLRVLEQIGRKGKQLCIWVFRHDVVVHQLERLVHGGIDVAEEVHGNLFEEARVEWFRKP